MNNRLHFNPYLEFRARNTKGKTQEVQCLVEREKWVPIRFTEIPHFSGGIEADM